LFIALLLEPSFCYCSAEIINGRGWFRKLSLFELSFITHIFLEKEHGGFHGTLPAVNELENKRQQKGAEIEIPPRFYPIFYEKPIVRRIL